MSAQKEAQSKLSLAFLNHQVEKLEQSVEQIQFSRDARLYQPIKPTKRKGKREKRIVDSSAFIYALPLIKRWIREDSFQIIVPLQVISTLDILKKASNPIKTLANEATRFLGSQFSIARQIESEAIGSGLKDRSEWDHQIRLRAQYSEEEIPWGEVEKKFRLPSNFVIPEVIQIEGEEPIEPIIPLPSDIPKVIRSTLQCSLYHKLPLVLYNDSEIDSLPTPERLIAPSRLNGSENLSAPIFHPILACGNQITFWSNYFEGIELQTIATCEIIASKEWAKQQAQLQLLAKEESAAKASSRSRRNPSSRGGGSGGRGGRGNDDSRKGARGRGDNNVATPETSRDAAPTMTSRGRGKSSGVLFIP